MRVPALLVMIAVLVAAPLLTACGKKVWPQPVKAQDRFYWGAASGEMSHGCLTVRAVVDGVVENLAEVTLEVGQNDCPGCPFSPFMRLTFDDPGVFLDCEARTVTVTACDLAPGTAYRWRLKGANRLARMSSQVSEVGTAGDQ